MDITRVESLYIRARRARVTMRDLCLVNGVSPSTPARWRSGTMSYTDSTLTKLEVALDAIEAEALAA